MNRRVLIFVALAITLLYGAGFAIFDGDVPSAYGALGAVVVTLSWVCVGMFGRDDRPDDATPAPFGPTNDAPTDRR